MILRSRTHWPNRSKFLGCFEESTELFQFADADRNRNRDRSFVFWPRDFHSYRTGGGSHLLTDALRDLAGEMSVGAHPFGFLCPGALVFIDRKCLMEG